MKAKSVRFYSILLSTLLTVGGPIWAGPSQQDLARITHKIELVMAAAHLSESTVFESGTQNSLNGDSLKSLLIKGCLVDEQFEYQLDNYIKHIERVRDAYHRSLSEQDIRELSQALTREVNNRLSPKAFLFKNIEAQPSIYEIQKTIEAKRLIDFLFETAGIRSDTRIKDSPISIMNGIKLKSLLLKSYLHNDINSRNLLSRVRSAMSAKDPKAVLRTSGRESILMHIEGYYERIGRIAETEFIEKFRAEDQRPWHSAHDPLELTEGALQGEIRHLPIVDVIGFGSKNQFASIEEMEAAAKLFVTKWNSVFHGRWIVAYGGDSANPEKPDVGLLVKYIRDTYGIPVLAVQSDIVKHQWGGVDKWIDFVHYVPTDKSTNAEGKETVLWGGVKDGKTIGASKVMFNRSSPLFREALTEGIVGVGIFGGGEIAKSELALAEKLKLQIDYYPLHAKNPNPGHPLGEVFDRARRHAAFEPPTDRHEVRSCKDLFL